MISSMLELMLADLKGEDVSKLTQEDIDRRKFGRLDEATQTKKSLPMHYSQLKEEEERDLPPADLSRAT